MRKILSFAVLAGSVACFAQEGGPRRGFRFPNPLVVAMDTDGDGTLSADEIRNSAKSLMALDKDGNGQLTAEELRPNFPNGERPNGERREGGPAPNADDLTRTLMAFDKNGDGKLSKDELPERMQGMLERGDKNHDGFLTPDEIRQLAAVQQPAGPGGDHRGGPEGERRFGGEGRGGPGGGGFMRNNPVFAALDLNQDGVLSSDEIRKAPQSLLRLDANGDGQLTPDEIRPRFGPGGDRDRQPRMPQDR